MYAGCSIFMGRGSVCGLFSLYHGTRQCMRVAQSSWEEAVYAGCSVYIMGRDSVCRLFSLNHGTRQCMRVVQSKSWDKAVYAGCSV